MRQQKYEVPGALTGTVLERIVAARLRDVSEAMHRLPAGSLAAALDRAPAVRSFSAALSGRFPAFIAEIKKASPSAGLLRDDFDPLAIAREYELSGAAALSVVTEAHFFRGTLETLAQLRWNTSLPLLRKDFIVDSYQVLEARHAGADAVLLIAALLDDKALTRLRELSESFGMDSLVEVHSEEELRRALDSGARIVGVNNRDLRTFDVSLQTSMSLAPLFPAGAITVSESGIRSREDVERLASAGYRAFLVGETLVRAASPGDALRQLAGAPRAKRARA